LQQAKDSESKRADAEHATAVTWQAKAEDYRKQNKSLRKKLAVSVLLNIAEGVGLASGFKRIASLVLSAVSCLALARGTRH
jgi:hypothetical protein